MGDDGAAQERVQDFYRQIFELVQDEEWPNAPVGPRSAIPRIAVKANEFANTWDVLGPLIEERLWPNPRYSWLSGVLQHRTNRVPRRPILPTSLTTTRIRTRQSQHQRS